MANNRVNKLNSEMLKILCEGIVTIKDPKKTELVSITEVNVTNDLKHAKVFVSIFSNNEEKKTNTLNAIKNAAGYLRSYLAARMKIRTVPELHFEQDSSLDYGDKIERILYDLKMESNIDKE